MFKFRRYDKLKESLETRIQDQDDFEFCEDLAYNSTISQWSKHHNKKGRFWYVNGATKISTPNHSDPNYTDVCYEITREMCDFCCLVDFEFCSRDIGICEPITDRDLGLLVDCALVLGGILCGFPIIIACCSLFLT